MGQTGHSDQVLPKGTGCPVMFSYLILVFFILFKDVSQFPPIADSISNHVQEDLSPCTSSSSSINIDAEEAASSSSRSASELEQFVNDLLNK